MGFKLSFQERPPPRLSRPRHDWTCILDQCQALRSCALPVYQVRHRHDHHPYSKRCLLAVLVLAHSDNVLRPSSLQPPLHFATSGNSPALYFGSSCISYSSTSRTSWSTQKKTARTSLTVLFLRASSASRTLPFFVGS